MWFLNQMIMLPVAALFYGMEMFAKTVQGIQEMASHSMNAMAGEIAQLLDNAPSGKNDVPSDIPSDTRGESAHNTSQTVQQEERHMPDLDLGGDDLKYVRYSIVFTKRDYETTLQLERQEIVDYPTDGGSFGGLKIAEFFAKGEIIRPATWIRSKYPSAGSPERISPTQIPDDDTRYVKFIYHVDQRLPKSAEDYEKRQTRALEDISSKIG
jgi:hypothetical protein